MKLLLGRDVAHNEPVYLDAGGARAVLICGKRGSGKSYTLGVFVEELKDLTLKFRGSRNQRIIDVKKSKEDVVLYID